MYLGPMDMNAPAFTASHLKVACSNCNLRELCMPLGLNDQQLQRIDDIVATRRKVKRGGTLFRNGDRASDIFTPVAAPLMAVHKRLKDSFDPHGIFNPGRLYADF